MTDMCVSPGDYTHRGRTRLCPPRGPETGTPSPPTLISKCQEGLGLPVEKRQILGLGLLGQLSLEHPVGLEGKEVLGRGGGG